MARLIELEQQRTHELSAHVVIGRSGTCTVRLDDPMVSANHAEIIRDPNGKYTLRDLGSRRGTFVGSRKVTEVALQHGDELMIGPSRMRFEDAPPVPAVTIAQELVRLRAIVALGHAIGVEHDVERVLEAVLATCFQLLDADRGAIVVYEPHSKTPFMTVTRTRSGGRTPFAVSTALLGDVMATHKPYLREEVRTDVVLQRSQSLSVDGVRSVIAVPLCYQSNETEWMGLIQLDSSAMSKVFAPPDLDLLMTIAAPAALSIKNAMLVRQVQSVVSDEWRRLERMVRDLPSGIVVLDEHRTCVLVNAWASAHANVLGELCPGRVVESVLGVSCAQLLGNDVRTQVMPPDSNRAFAITVNTSPDGRETLLVIDDVTEELERQNQAAHRDRVALVGQLAGGVAHDFNNLLQVILACAGMLEDSTESTAARDDAQEIIGAATSASELTRQLLTFSRRELVAPEAINVTQVVHSMEKMLLRTLGPQIDLVTSVEAGLPRILMGTSQLEQIVMNLVVNARDAMPSGGRVGLTVSTTQLDAASTGRQTLAAGKYVCIEVSDAGSGMSPEVIRRVFEPYFTTKTRGQGTGLGLATVHGIVHQAGGDIGVESRVGEGTTFRIHLPVTDQSADEGRLIQGGVARTGTVLLVDDDDAVRRITERVLRGAGHTVLSAASGPAALALARAHGGELDLLLTDLVMPGMSGKQLAQEICEDRPTLQVLFMSGYHQHEPFAGVHFIPKPFQRAQLLESVRGLFTRPTDAVTSRV
jgi:signal transduction histidine kinase